MEAAVISVRRLFRQIFRHAILKKVFICIVLTAENRRVNNNSICFLCRLFLIVFKDHSQFYLYFYSGFTTCSIIGYSAAYYPCKALATFNLKTVIKGYNEASNTKMKITRAWYKK